MLVSLLSLFPEKLAPTVLRAGDEWTSSVEPLTDVSAEWIVSFGYRHIIREPYLSRFKDRMINVHISMLPWNRGADPNFWSWFDRTPKGVSIHLIDAGIDTGNVLAQAEVVFQPDMTLRTSYDILMERAACLFEASWPAIRQNAARAIPTDGIGSYHGAKDRELWWQRLPFGYDTPVAEIEEMGSQFAAGKTTFLQNMTTKSKR